MTGERFARLRALVEGGHDLDEEELARYLDAECGGDAGLRSEALGLIEAARASAALFEPPPAGRWAELADAPELRIGGFRILERIASGGMGTVFAAEQDEPRRKVALKMLRLGFDAPDDVKRFRREAEILSRLQHPHVAQVFAAGVERDPTGGPGLPWYAMEFVEGAHPLSEHARGLPLEQRLQLFETLCRAVQHAHERGVIHRDLKPGNALVGRDGVLKVIDFGVAAIASGPQGGPTRLTRAGTLVGTLDYMPPERLRGKAEEHDTRGDVYALGVMLYELVCGRLPHDLAQLSLFEAAELVGERTPAPPSSVVRGASRDLDAVVQKALARERDFRYASAEALAVDVERVRRGEPVEARPPTVLTQVRSLARRHRLFLSAAASGLIALLAGLVVSVALLLRAQRAERDARAGEEAYRRRDYVASIAAAHGALRAGDVNRALSFLERTPADLRGFEWEHLRARTDRSADTWPTGAEVVEDLVWLPGGGKLALLLRDGQLELRSASGERLLELSPRGVLAFDLAADPSGELLAVALHGGEVRLYPVEGGAPRAFDAHERAVFCLAFSGDGRRLATAGPDGKARIWSFPALERELELEAGREWPSSLAFLPGLDRLAVGHTEGVVEIYDVLTGERVLTVGDTRAGQLSEIAVSSDGALLAASYHDGEIRVWRLPGGEPLATLFGHAGIVERLAFAPQGPLLASAGRDRSIRIWDASAGGAAARLLGHLHEVTALAWSAAGDVLASGDEGGRVKLWPRDAADVPVAPVAGRWDWRLAYAPDGAALASLHGGFAELRDPATGAVRERIPGLPSRRSTGVAEWRAVAFDPTGRFLALGDDEGRIRISARDGSSEPAVFPGGGGGVRALAWSPAGLVLSAGGLAGRVAHFTPGGAPAGEELLLEGSIEGLSYSAAGVLAALSAVGELVLVDARGARTAHRLEGGARTLAWCGEERLAVGTFAGAIHLFDARQGEVAATLAVHRRSVEGLALSPDGTRLASCSMDRSIRLFDLERGLETWVNDEHDYLVLALAFAPDGRALASGSADGTLRLWDTRAPRRGRLDDPSELATVAWMSALAPDVELSGLGPLAQEVRRRCAEDAGDAELLRALAAVELALGRPQESLDALERRRALAEETAELLLLRSIALGRLDRPEEALAVRDQARALAGPLTSVGLLARLLERSRGTAP